MLHGSKTTCKVLIWVSVLLVVPPRYQGDGTALTGLEMVAN